MGGHLSESSYLRHRLTPRPGDPTYLHLADLRRAAEELATNQPLVILDYGCGGSPYRSLFPNADYRRADFVNGDSGGIDYPLDPHGTVTEADAVFDFILSTQVLEHVNQPSVYLDECYRLLKDGGQLYLTTHGSYPDHGCPYDYRRWTADGLAEDIRAAGFEVVRLQKQTTGPRAFFLQFDYQLDLLRAPRRTVFGLFLICFRWLFAALRPWVHRMCDRYFPEYRVVETNLAAHRVYAVAACLARKP